MNQCGGGEPESIQRAVANSSKISGGAGVYGLWAKQKVGYSSGQEINEGRHTKVFLNLLISDLCSLYPFYPYIFFFLTSLN